MNTPLVGSQHVLTVEWAVTECNRPFISRRKNACNCWSLLAFILLMCNVDGATQTHECTQVQLATTRTTDVLKELTPTVTHGGRVFSGETIVHQHCAVGITLSEVGRV